MRFAKRFLTSVPLMGAALFSTSIPQLSADELNGFSSLDTVTVYATRSERAIFDVPGIVTQVDPNLAGNANAGTYVDLFQFTPGVEVAGGPRRNSQTLVVRGFDNEAIITLIDGRRQNFESGHDGRFFIDPNLLKSVEVVKGASSAIYGGGGLGGVVAFETKEAADLLAPGQTMGYMTSLGYRSANEEISPSLTAFAQSGAWDILGNVSYRNSSPIELGNDEEEFIKEHFGSALLNLAYKPNEFTTVKLNTKASINYSKEPNSGDDAVTTSNPVVNKRTSDYQAGLKYAYNDPNNDLFAPKFHVYFNQSEVKEENTSGSNQGRIRKRQLDTFGFTADSQSRYEQDSHATHTLSYGFEYIYNEQTASDSTATLFGGAPNADGSQFGFYLQDEVELKTAMGDFLIIPAARYDHYESQDTAGNSQDKDGISPKVSATYKPTENISFFGSWAQAFRGPNLTETYASGVHYSIPFVLTNNFIPNPDLKPETVTTVEVGAKVRADQLLAENDSLSLSGSWFTSKGKDFITQTVAATTTQYVNIDNAVLKGFEAEAVYQLNPVQLKLGASWVHARNSDTGEYLLNYTPLTFVADVNYTFEEYNSLIGWRARVAADNDKVEAGGTPTEGYDVHDIYFRWTPDMQGHESVTVDLGVENVFDAAYQKKFSDLFAEGRSYVAKVNYKW